MDSRITTVVLQQKQHNSPIRDFAELVRMVNAGTSTTPHGLRCVHLDTHKLKTSPFRRCEHVTTRETIRKGQRTYVFVAFRGHIIDDSDVLAKCDNVARDLRLIGLFLRQSTHGESN